MKLIIDNVEFNVPINFFSICDVIRQQRDVLLQKSDWTQLPDVTIPNKTEWATYRQSLRDFINNNQEVVINGLANSNEPLVINFPAPPQE